jgi:hypothetical protein
MQRKVEDLVISSTMASWLARRVVPVAVLSTMISASSGGKTSVEPKVL